MGIPDSEKLAQEFLNPKKSQHGTALGNIREADIDRSLKNLEEVTDIGAMPLDPEEIKGAEVDDLTAFQTALKRQQILEAIEKEEMALRGEDGLAA